MDYGKPAFKENQSIIGTPNNSPIEWNMNVGLDAFAESVEIEFKRVNQKLDEILRLLKGR